MIGVTRYNPATGEKVGDITAPIQTIQAEYRLFGGCSICRINFVSKWTQPIEFLCEDGEEIVVTNDGVPVFSGRVVSVQPYLEDIQIVQITGWWQRLDEIELVSPLADRISFGPSDDEDAQTDHPEIRTAYDVVQWLTENAVLSDTQSQLATGTILPPTTPCKLGGPFVIYSSDKLCKVLETLATMEDCVCGIAADRSFYYVPRQQLLSTPYFTAQVADSVPADWRSQRLGLAVEGNFIRDRRGPNQIEVHSRDINALEGIRSYRLKDALPGTRRAVSFYAPNIHSGVQARRYARGLFRRFARFSDLKVSRIECVTGPMRFEPYLGAVTVTNKGQEVCTDLAGSMDVTFLPALTVGVSLGENESDPGSGNPANDPWAPDVGQTPSDVPQVDTGDGLEDPELYPIPSGEIDFEDGWDGDGDDFHFNPNREFWTDPPGEGVPGVDYGTDQRNPDNGKGSGGGTTTPEVAHWIGVITNNGGTSGKPSVQIRYPNGAVYGAFSSVDVWPPAPAGVFQVGQGVLCFFPKGSPRGGRTSNPIIDGTAFGRMWPVRIESLDQLPKYRIALYEADLTTIIAYFDNVPAWPEPDAPFALHQKLWATFPSGTLTPVIIGHEYVRVFGIGNGPECLGTW